MYSRVGPVGELISRTVDRPRGCYDGEAVAAAVGVGVVDGAGVAVVECDGFD